MKKALFSVLFFMVLSGVAAAGSPPEEGSFGLGVILGEPTGISFKKWFASTIAVDGALGVSFYKDDSFAGHADFLFHTYDIFKPESGKLPLYFGFGARVKSGDDDALGIRIPVGLDYLFQKEPIDVFVELVPVLDVAPSVVLTINAGVGVRYYF